MRLLIIGGLNGHIGAAMKIALESGAEVSQVEDISSAMRALRGGQGFELAMIDVALDVETFIGGLRAERINIPVVACGIGTDPTAAVRAIKAGASEYVPLPPDAELIAAVLAAVSLDSDAIVHADPAMAAVLRFAEKIAVSEATVLIYGESGTGKELIARHIHRRSRRARARLVSVNCAAIPDNLLESELFGHEKGAFTGAVARRIGKFEEANGGTLLLDEISEMDIRLQAKLLRAIQEREIDRVGGAKPVRVDIRLVATTNIDLEEQVRLGRFREDLLYRLNVVTVNVPPLRERPGDILPLANYFVRKFSDSNGMALREIPADALEKLRRHVWRGNVRELENTMHRAVLIAQDDEIGAEAILLNGSNPHSAYGPAVSSVADATARAVGSDPLVGRTVAEVERDLIIGTLHHCLGNRTHAATILGISIRTLRNKLKQYGADGVNIPMPRDHDRVAV